MIKMRAKMRVSNVASIKNQDGATGYEQFQFHAVAKDESYPTDGTDENNTFAKWTPTAVLTMTVTNPELFGQIREGELYYLDFTPVDK